MHKVNAIVMAENENSELRPDAWVGWLNRMSRGLAFGALLDDDAGCPGFKLSLVFHPAALFRQEVDSRASEKEIKRIGGAYKFQEKIIFLYK